METPLTGLVDGKKSPNNHVALGGRFDPKGTSATSVYTSLRLLQQCPLFVFRFDLL